MPLEKQKSLKETFDNYKLRQTTYLMHPQVWKCLCEDQKRLNELQQQGDDMPGIEYTDIDHWFTYHPPQGTDQVEAYDKIREAGKEFAKVVLGCTPTCADQTVAIRAIRESVMWANAAIACDVPKKVEP